MPLVHFGSRVYFFLGRKVQRSDTFYPLSYWSTAFIVNVSPFQKDLKKVLYTDKSTMDTFPIPIQRLARLSDLIFAVAMTLMALTFDTFPSAKMTPQEVALFLQAQLPDLGIYALTFITIGFNWTTHLNQFKYYKSTDIIHLWLTLFVLTLCSINASCQCLV